MTDENLPATTTQTAVAETGQHPLEASEGVPATASEHGDTSMIYQ